MINVERRGAWKAVRVATAGVLGVVGGLGVAPDAGQFINQALNNFRNPDKTAPEPQFSTRNTDQIATAQGISYRVFLPVITRNAPPSRPEVNEGTPIATPTPKPDNTPTPTATRTATPTPTPTFSPTPEPTTTRSATPTPVEDICPDANRWWPVSSNGPVFEFTSLVTPEDRQAIKDNLGVAMEGVKSRTGYETKNIWVPSYTNVIDFAQHFDLTIAEATRRVNWGEDCGLLQVGDASSGWRLTGSPLQRMAHGYTHNLQMGLANHVEGTDPMDQVPAVGPVWSLEGGAVYTQLLLDHNNGREWYVNQAKSTSVLLRNTETKQQFWNGTNSTTDQRYGLAFLAVEYLVSTTDHKTLFSFWEGIGKGLTWKQSFEQNFGRSPDAFYQDFEAYRASVAGSAS